MTDSKLYKYNTENMKATAVVLDNIALSCKDDIRKSNDLAVKSYVSVYTLFLGAWIENKARKLVLEKDSFTKEEQVIINNESSQYDKWKKIIEVAFRKHYSIPHAELNDMSLPFSAFTKYEALYNILETYLKNIIETRNKVAHGQLIYPLNNDCTDIQTEKLASMKKENILSLQYKKELVNYLSKIIHDLVVSINTFDRDFDLNYTNIVNCKNNLINREYKDYKIKLIKKYKDGIEKRKANKLVVNNTNGCKEIFSKLLSFIWLKK
jgi:hypothetical protein